MFFSALSEYGRYMRRAWARAETSVQLPSITAATLSLHDACIELPEVALTLRINWVRLRRSVGVRLYAMEWEWANRGAKRQVQMESPIHPSV